MISIDEHPPQQQQQLSYEAFASVSDIDLLKPNTTDDANLDDTNYQLSNFSIRDYVFGSRCKDIACNWPFSSKTLQLCMNSGVKNLLPPFQSLNSSVRKCAFDNRLPDEETVGDDDEILANRMSNNKSTLVSSEKMVKNCKFIMKLNLGVRPVTEEVKPNNFVDKEITVSKVCPVCKTFISSSNTTLNAHIDRCLSDKSSMKWTANYPKVAAKHKVKPRKMRLMVDIYKTALHCTIEELDKRNGTSWTTDSSFHDQEIDEFRAEEEEKKEEPQVANFVSEIDGHEDHEGAVYVDTNGKKVRILSMPKVSNVNDLESRKLMKGGKGSKKKAYGKKNHQKLIPNSKKLGKKIVDKPATSGQEGSNKEARVEKHVAITRPPWACSKRTDLAKKRFNVLSKPKGGEEIPSLQKKLTSASQEDDTGSKFSMKRKFSGVKNCLSTDDDDDDISGPSQDSSKKSRMEGDHIETDNEKLSLEIENTSSNGDESSGGLEITSESAKTDDQVLFQSDYGIMGNFMGLKNSNDDFLSQMSNTFDSQNGMDDDHIEKKGSYFEDPIPIPGPPGSFLPLSPGAHDDDMVSEEELQAHSSLTTTSRVDQSNEDPNLHHEVMKMDFISDSPISTVSSPNFARSASTRFQDVVNDFRSGLFSLTLSQPAPVDTLKFPVYNRDYDSVVSPTPSTPVLRLMGQNLTVVNNTMYPTTTNGHTAHPKETVVIDDSSETETDDHHALFKQQRNGSRALLEKSYSFANNTYNGGVFPVFREIVDGGNHGTERVFLSESITRVSSSTSYYPRSFSLPRTQREGGL